MRNINFWWDGPHRLQRAIPEVTATFQSFGKIKVPAAQVLAYSSHEGSWIHKDLYIECPKARLSRLLILPKMILFSKNSQLLKGFFCVF